MYQVLVRSNSQCAAVLVLANASEPGKLRSTRWSYDAYTPASLAATCGPASHEAHIQVGQTNRVILPADAVIKRGKTWHAFVVKNGELEERLVQLGATPGENQVSIVQGVAKGEKVATKLDAKIVDGLKVVE